MATLIVSFDALEGVPPSPAAGGEKSDATVASAAGEGFGTSDVV